VVIYLTFILEIILSDIDQGTDSPEVFHYIS
jgi:hypothetical protein